MRHVKLPTLPRSCVGTTRLHNHFAFSGKAADSGHGASKNFASMQICPIRSGALSTIIIGLCLAYEFGLEAHSSDAVDFAVDVVIAVN